VAEETGQDEGYRFFRAADLAASAVFFCCSALLALACFCEDFFWLDFGDRSPIILILFRGLIHLRHVSFSEGMFSMPAGAGIVNDGRKIIRPLATIGLASLATEFPDYGQKHSCR
jgi:hypothetical protein